jgi:5-methylcytosine-specific restriction enzyme B
MHDLTTDEGLRAALADAEAADAAEAASRTWHRDVAALLEAIAGLDRAGRASLDFQQRLWDDNPISATGQGTIDVGAVLADPEFRDWLAGASLAALPDDPAARLKHLEQLYDELCRRLLETCPRLPRLKALRALAALFPGELTCITDSSRAGTLARLITGKKQVSGDMARQVAIRRRLDALLGPVAPGFDAQARRLRLPWHLYRQTQASGEEPTIEPDVAAGAELIPLPAARRRRGLTAIGGKMNLVLSCLDAVKDGLGPEDLRTFLKNANPRLKEGSLNSIRYTLQFELGAMEWRDDAYRPTERGLALLESGDPIELADWLLTHVLGPDHVLVRLRDEGPCAKPELFALLQHANPGWGTDFAPSSILNWLRILGVLDTQNSQAIHLTADGRRWAELIHWTPEVLPVEPIGTGPATGIGTATAEAVQLPDEAALTQAVAQAGHFPPALVVRLHAALWAHKRRHFAVLTGLSGSGKTLLACAYARALHADDAARHAANLQVIAVQPGWYDPSPLLGYLNPLRGDTYQRTAFLDFLIRAGEEPERPFVAVLDEMNLSHPEQYLAPLLSAMESGAALDLHQEAEPVDGVPSKLAYPPNLALIGTVNMDETTHGLSDKVLDRAFTLEFWDIDLDDYPRWGARELDAAVEQRARALLTALMAALRPARLHFGWRVVDDVLDFLAHCRGSDIIDADAALDQVIYAKLLPKLRGDDSRRFRDALNGCLRVLDQHGCPGSLAKVRELAEDLETLGSARFWR